MACFLNTTRLSTESFPQDSPLVKTICAIPFIGAFPQIIVEKELVGYAKNRIHTSDGLTDLIHLKNNYKIGGILRDCLGIALLVAGVAAGIISAATLILYSIITIGLAAYQIYKIEQNRKACQTLANSPFILTSVRVY